MFLFSPSLPPSMIWGQTFRGEEEGEEEGEERGGRGSENAAVHPIFVVETMFSQILITFWFDCYSYFLRVHLFS